ncbi:MAG TPA: hypothetical protein VHD84_02690 [Candidatus Saccharimonadales bacterium]|nr:hypothetical protein [Candidatus Saccharimonadales bacterium]
MPDKFRLDARYQTFRTNLSQGDDFYDIDTPVSPVVDSITPDVIEAARHLTLDLMARGTETKKVGGFISPEGLARYDGFLYPKRRAVSISLGGKALEFWRKAGEPISLRPEVNASR